MEGERDHLCGQRLIPMQGIGANWHYIRPTGKPKLLPVEQKNGRYICPGCDLIILAQDLLELDAARSYRCIECNAKPGADCKDSNGKKQLFHEGRRNYVFQIKTLEKGHRSHVGTLNTKSNKTPKRLAKGPQGVLF